MAAHDTSFAPSATHLLVALPRLVHKASLGMSGTLGKLVKQLAADPTFVDGTATSPENITLTVTSHPSPSMFGAAMREVWRDASSPESTSSLMQNISTFIGRAKSFGGIFSYLTSKWALTTFIAAIVLNRTQFYASSRKQLRLRFHVRLTLYLIPIIAILAQTITILETLRCQTSPNYAAIHYDDSQKRSAMDFAGDGGFLYSLSSFLLFWKDDAASCAAQGMSFADGQAGVPLRGSLSLLYRFFMTICASQLFETLSCALQGRLPMPETGMTIFEHSLAFAECEAMLNGLVGLDFFGFSKTNATMSSAANVTSPEFNPSDLVPPPMNVPPEVLLVCLVSCFSHLSSAILATLGIRHRYRLINTAVWACSYIAAFAWIFTQLCFFPVNPLTDQGVLRFPTVCVVGFIPHVLILFGIIVCGGIYGMAMLITALSIPEEAGEGLTIRQRIAWAYNNLQANVQFSQNSSIRIKMSEDFYTTLLKVGFHVLTAASEAVYLNEGSHIQVASMTWLEQKRIDELATGIEAEKRKGPAVPLELIDEGMARGIAFVDQRNASFSSSPYACERKSKPAQTDAEKTNVREMDSGLGITQRRSRMHLTFDFIWGIAGLLIGALAQIALNMLTRLGVGERPVWLLKAAGTVQRRRSSSQDPPVDQVDPLAFYMIGPDGKLSLPSDDHVDVEAETRRRLLDAGTYRDEEQLSENLYGWWRSGGWFGDVDQSGDYEALEVDDEDTTSIISASTNASAWEDIDDINSDDDDDEDATTPTSSFFPAWTRDPTPAPEEPGMSTKLLARLLDPQTIADRDEAQLLSYSLKSSRPMTRSHYRRERTRQRAEILTGLRTNLSANSSQSSTPQPISSSEEEERELEQFILTQRAKRRDPFLTMATRPSSFSASTSWESGADGMGAEGPQCVVCQSAPRSILVWPCGCLSMCDDCRLGLAARNYTQCICCRTEIVAYSRLYVP